MSDVENCKDLDGTNFNAKPQDGFVTHGTTEQEVGIRVDCERILSSQETKDLVPDTGSIKSATSSPRRTPFWPAWQKRPICSLGNAVALSLNINPGALMRTKKKYPVKYKTYLARLKTSGLQAYQGGQIEVIKDHPNSGEEVKSRIISLASFVCFSMTQERWLAKLPPEFIQLKDIYNTLVPDLQNTGGVDSAKTLGLKVKRKAPDKFVSSLIKLLVEIAKRASIKNVEFDVQAMPGIKEDLRAIAVVYDVFFLNYTARTFDDYLDHLCYFKKGSRSNDFYSILFPDDAPKFRHIPIVTTQIGEYKQGAYSEGK